MRVLTFGWDYPPQTAGGLGMACYGLTNELIQDGVEVVFVLPRQQKTLGKAKFVFADTSKNVVIREVSSGITPYAPSGTLIEMYDVTGKKMIYSRTLIQEVHAYAHQASLIAKEESFDVIHAHDWTTYLAGVAAKIASGKPLILHVHATAYDQAASENVDPAVFEIEKESFMAADVIVAVSRFTRDILIKRYGVNPLKIEVVHNGVETNEPVRYDPTLKELKAAGKKIVLYHGRITVQKGVDYFVKAAKKVVDYDPNIVFIISGKGDMEAQIMHQVGELGLSSNVIFAGGLWYEERDRMYQSVDLVVMPSVSEPFGLVPLEAMQHGTPSLISKQSGVAEVMSHVLKVDFWDVDEMANKILSALRYPVLRNQLVNEGKKELAFRSWYEVAHKIKDIYYRLIQYLQQSLA